jgi:hypothetical protein
MDRMEILMATLTPMKLVPIEQVRPSTYNPRQADPARLDLVELSLAKLGFVLPLFADANGELLSGHQRHHVAERMGFKHVPVAFTKAFDLNTRKAINLAFNRGTNDFSTADSSKSITERIQSMDLIGLASSVPDKDLQSPSAFRTMSPKMVPIKEVLLANRGRLVDYAAAITRTLANKGILMPIVATADFRVCNGVGRLQYLAEQGATEVPLVIVSDEEAELSEALLNLLSMDFDLHTRYADLLRFNSFRRSRGKRSVLGRAFVDYVWQNKITGANVDLVANQDQKRAWVREHGTSVVEFGGGHCTDGDLLRAAGIHCASFEPYRLNRGDEIDKARSVAQTIEFLADVASGRSYSSVFCPAVLNSVPFRKDRQHVLMLCAALCGSATKFYVSAVNVSNPNFQYSKGAGGVDARSINQPGFILDYEPNTRIADLTSLPKMQHYFTPKEMGDLCLERWSSAKAFDLSGNTYCIARDRKPLDLVALVQAIQFEFDLPYPDGSRMGLVKEALFAFGARVGENLLEIPAS